MVRIAARDRFNHPGVGLGSSDAGGGMIFAAFGLDGYVHGRRLFFSDAGVGLFLL
ncbi:MAG: hypothetical protein PHE53_11900 [Thermoguttaceae bacterium]|nr:hypothetical protein [Thermoguttaceae bacterium]